MADFSKYPLSITGHWNVCFSSMAHCWEFLINASELYRAERDHAPQCMLYTGKPCVYSPKKLKLCQRHCLDRVMEDWSTNDKLASGQMVEWFMKWKFWDQQMLTISFGSIKNLHARFHELYQGVLSCVKHVRLLEDAPHIGPPGSHFAGLLKAFPAVETIDIPLEWVDAPFYEFMDLDRLEHTMRLRVQGISDSNGVQTCLGCRKPLLMSVAETIHVEIRLGNQCPKANEPKISAEPCTIPKDVKWPVGKADEQKSFLSNEVFFWGQPMCNGRNCTAAAAAPPSGQNTKKKRKRGPRPNRKNKAAAACEPENPACPELSGGSGSLRSPPTRRRSVDVGFRTKEEELLHSFQCTKSFSSVMKGLRGYESE